MSFEDPVNVYIADTNEQAFLLKQKLETDGITAEVTEDHSTVGLSLFGPIFGIHRPQIWVRRQDSEAAIRFLAEYIVRKRRRTRENEEAIGEIEIICDDCGKTIIFPGSMAGTVQECDYCFTYLDVGGDDQTFGDEWQSRE